MCISVLERLKARVALRFRALSSSQQWVCEDCYAHLRRASRPVHSSSNGRTDYNHYGRPPTTPYCASEPAGPSVRHTRITPHLRTAPAPTTTASISLAEFQNDGLRNEAFEASGGGEQMRARRLAFLERLMNHDDNQEFSDLEERPVSELTHPQNWPMVQWLALAPFRDFLSDQVEPDYSTPRQPSDRLDPYGLMEVLRKKDPFGLIQVIETAADDASYLGSIPLSTWTQILFAMAPRRFEIYYHKIHRSFTAQKLNYVGFDYKDMVGRYLSAISRIMQIRREHNIIPDVVDYQILLTYTAMIGATTAAKRYWTEMSKDGVKPDLICYNRYLEALIWDEESRLRLEKKGLDSKPKYKFKETNIALFKRGKSGEVAQIMSEMRKRSVTPDVSTYCVLLTVLARDARFQQAYDVIGDIWHFNISAVAAGRADMPLGQAYSPSSPLCPTPRLLNTIAEVYGLANRMPAGFRIIDYLSRHYDLPLKKHIWYQLLRWTWLQARVKPHQREIPEDNPQQLSERTVRTLLDTMIAPPYNIELDLDILQIAFKNYMNSPFAFAKHFDPSLALEILESLRLDFIKLARENYEHNRQQVDSRLEGLSAWMPSHLRVPGSISLDFREPFSERKKMMLHRMTLVTWTKQMMQIPRTRNYGVDLRSGAESDTITNWRVRGLPQFLEEWAYFAPDTIEYQTNTGTVRLDLRTREETEVARIRTRAGAVHRAVLPKATRQRHLQLRKIIASPIRVQN